MGRFRSAYDGHSDDASIHFGTDFTIPSTTQQSGAEDADINTIVRRFNVTGLMPRGAYTPSYGDFDGISDYRQALDAVKLAQENFGNLPADVRERFHNDPQAFLEFCSKSENLPEMAKMGLAAPPVAPARKEEPPAPPPVPPKE